jgi:uncharacterized DUF497 family protein
MRIDFLHCDEEVELHIWSRHRVVPEDAREACYFGAFVRKGRSEGVYLVFGRSETGRYLTVIVRYRGRGVASVITARDMDAAERRHYERMRAH